MHYKYIEFERKDKIAWIVLNCPEKLNALNRDMVEEIGQALENADQDSAIRVVIITGKGKAFCAGADLNFAREELSTLWKQEEFFRWANKTMMERIERLSKPVIAAVNGFALGGGFELMLACDLVIAAEDAVIADQHINYGLVGPGGSTQKTTWLIGARKAKEIILTGKRLSGKEAQQIGLVNDSVPLDQLENAVEALAEELAQKSPVALRIAKTLINRAQQVNLSLSSELEVMSAIVNNSSEDYEEGMRAFKEKRKPVFKGR
jgi:enoyl-CoA hydratase/carnithine racemase